MAGRHYDSLILLVVYLARSFSVNDARELFAAFEKDDIEAVNDYISQHRIEEVVKFSDSEGFTLLMLAAFYGRVPMAWDGQRVAVDKELG